MSSSSNIYFSIPNYSDWNLLKDAQVTAEMALASRPQLLTPSLTYNVHGIAADKKYSASVTIRRVDDYHYKYHKELNKFIPHQSIDNEPPSVVPHRDGAQLGAHWLANGLDFSWLALVHRKEQVTSSTALVESRCMYQPVVRIWETDSQETFWESSAQEQQFIALTGHIQPGFVSRKKALCAAKYERREALKRKMAQKRAEERMKVKKAKLEEIRKKNEASVEHDKENMVPVPKPVMEQVKPEPVKQPLPYNSLLQGYSFHLMIGALHLLQSSRNF